MIVREVVGRKATARVLVIVPAALRTQWKEELASLLDLPSIDAHAAWLRTITRELPPDVNPWSIPGIYLASIDFVKRPEVLGPAGIGALGSPRRGRGTWRDAQAPAGSLQSMRSAAGPRSSSCCPPRRIQESRTSSTRSAASAAARAIHRSSASAGRVPTSNVAQGPVRSRVFAVPPTDERAPDAPAARTLHVAVVGSRRGAATRTRRCWPRSFGNARSPAPALWPSPWSGGCPRWPPCRTSKRSPGCRSKATTSTRRQTRTPTACSAERASTIPSASGRLSSSVSRPPRPHPPPKAKQRDSSVSFPGSTPPPSSFPSTAIRRCGCATGLRPLGRQVVLLHGGLTPDERALVTTEFLRGGAVMVATDAASEGLNLHHSCRLVIHYELPWSPARLHQRCGRVNRIGQRRRVHEIALVAADTAEQLVLQPLLRRAPGLRPLQPQLDRPSVARGGGRCARSSTASRSPVRPIPCRRRAIQSRSSRSISAREARAEVERLERWRGSSKRLGAAVPGW